MPTTFRPYAPGQDLLLPESLQEWLPADHVAYFISEVVEELDLSAFYAPYEGDGRRRMPYEPSMMLKVLIYAYVSGVFSSRRIARRLEEDVAFRVLAAGNFPQHRTLCEFRRRHLSDFRALFVEVVQIARLAGLVSLGTLAADGTRLRANASRHKAMTYTRLKQEERSLREEIETMCESARRTDEAEDARYGSARRGDEMPEELQHRERRLETIRAAKARLEAEQRAADTARGRHADDDRRPPGGRGGRYKRDFGVPEDTAQSNFTDPESRIMKTSVGNPGALVTAGGDRALAHKRKLPAILQVSSRKVTAGTRIVDLHGGNQSRLRFGTYTQRFQTVLTEPDGGYSVPFLASIRPARPGVAK